MSPQMSPVDTAKYVAAKRACDFVESGMRLGLGTGSTAAWLVKCLGEMVAREGLKVTAVPTSRQTAELARRAGIEVVELDGVSWLDLTIDGADEVDGDLNLVKGGGGALLREKIVATASHRMIVIADGSKEVATLGAFPLPVEVIPFGWQKTRALVEQVIAGLDTLGGEVALRMDGNGPFVTDEGNHILDLDLKRIGDARKAALALNQVPGVVENGLFVDICDMLILGYGDGRVECRDPGAGLADEGRLDVAETANVFADPER